MKSRALFFTFAACLLVAGTAIAETVSETQQFDSYVSKLDRINYLPSLLPVIMENSDVIELTDEQIAALQAWRDSNKTDVIAAMNEIVTIRQQIKDAAISPDVSSARLIQMQNEAFRLQREILQYKLSCRDLVIETFSRNNWEGFFMVLAEQDMGIELPEHYMSKR